MGALLPLFLYVPFYISGDAARQAEFGEVLRRNLLGPAERVYLVSENTSALTHSLLFESNKLIFRETPRRPLFADVFAVINRIEKTRRHIPVIANADIIIDWQFFQRIDQVQASSEKTLLAITRWNLLNDGAEQPYRRHDSQDTWVFPPSGVRCDASGNFKFGVPGCDNAIAAEFAACGYCVRNPALSLRTKHLHNSNLRTYTAQDRVKGPLLQLVPRPLMLSESGKVKCPVSAHTISWRHAYCSIESPKSPREPIGRLDVLVVSMGGVGSSALMHELSKQYATNDASNKDFYKHAPRPPLNVDTNFAIYVLGSPAHSAASLFARDYHNLHSQTITDGTCEIPRNTTLASYMRAAQDGFMFADQIDAWLHTPTPYPIIFINTVHLTQTNAPRVVKLICNRLGAGDHCLRWSLTQRHSRVPPFLRAMYEHEERRVVHLPMLFERAPNSRTLVPVFSEK